MNPHRLRPQKTTVLALVGLSLASLALLLNLLFPPHLSRAQPPSVRVLDADGGLLRGFTTPDGFWRLPLQATQVDPLYLDMLLAYEDRRFRLHPGVDPLAVVRALGQWAVYGRVVSGASTLTMQVARLLEPRPRTLANKLREMLRALQLEWRYDKFEILDLYLNLAPYGGNLEGLRAASLAWLGKEPRQLTPAQVALLVVLPQAPGRLAPDRFPDAARSARDKVLARMARLGVLSPAQAAEARQEPLPKRRRPLPFHAPHLARRLALEHPENHVHHSTVDGPLQATLETLARLELSRLPPGASLALLVVENRDRAVRAYLGSADFFANVRDGQVDMVTAVRSPGSTLKPLIYGLGFDELLIHPQTLVDDVPTRFGDYRPANFLHAYHGEVTVREALQQSLNVPAVRVLERLGPARLGARLAGVGVKLRLPPGQARPGLPVALGGVGLTLEELTALYGALADGGRYLPLRLRSDDPTPTPSRLLGEAAAWQIGRILQDAPPPVDRTLEPGRRLIAHKTGTAYGFRDAWALGYDRDYTVGVWVGRPDAVPLPGHYGRNTAAPLLYRVFDLLPTAPIQPPLAVPAGVVAGPPPPALERLDPAPAMGTAPLHLSFPLDGSTVELAVRDDRLEPLPLVAEGGRLPLHWLVNGQPLPATGPRRQTRWSPDGPGLARVTVVDAEGRSARATVWLQTTGSRP